MANEKIKSENYTNLGGINNKISQYDTGPLEYLDLVNFDFQTPGALSQRWGSTMYFGQTFVAPVRSLYEYTMTTGTSFVFISHTGAIWYGATTGQNTLLGDTLLLSGYSLEIRYPYLRQQAGQLVSDQFYAYQFVTDRFGSKSPFGGSYATPWLPSQMSYGANNLDYVTFQNDLFMADGQKFIKWNGTSQRVFGVGVPPPVGGIFSFNSSVGGGDDFPVFQPNTGFYALYGAFIDSNQNEGPIWPLGILSTVGLSVGSFGPIVGTSYFNLVINIKRPPMYDIRGLNLYFYHRGSTIFVSEDLMALDKYFINSLGFATEQNANATLVQAVFGTTLAGISLGVLNNVGYVDPYTISDFIIGTTAIGTTAVSIQSIQTSQYYPQYMEIYQNRLFTSGFSATPSQVWFSEVGDPQEIQPENNFEVRTNDGDYVTAIKSYSTKLYILKRNSFYALYGDNPANFFVQEISLEYGCMNNKCAIVYDDLFLFLDRKGVVKYNGANIEVISNKVQHIFDTMNYTAALTEACMEHDKLRNQIIISIPVNGSTTNNVMVVFDYLVGSWTKYDGPKVSALRAIQGRNNSKNVFYGSYSGVVSWFGPSFTMDNGTGYTLYSKTRFIKPLGDSMEEQYRRLYINANTYGSTIAMEIDFYADYGPSIVLGRTMVISDYQKRMEYGIVASALSYEMTTIQTSQFFNIYGFTIESRLQRKVSGKG